VGWSEGRGAGGGPRLLLTFTVGGGLRGAVLVSGELDVTGRALKNLVMGF